MVASRGFFFRSALHQLPAKVSGMRNSAMHPIQKKRHSNLSNTNPWNHQIMFNHESFESSQLAYHSQWPRQYKRVRSSQKDAWFLLKVMFSFSFSKISLFVASL